MHTVQAPPSPSSSPGHGAAPVSCSPCGRSFSTLAFEALHWMGTDHAGAELVEVRRCPCGAHVRLSRGPSGEGLLL